MVIGIGKHQSIFHIDRASIFDSGDAAMISHLHLSLLPHLNPLSRPQSSPFLSSGSGLFRAGASWKGRLLQSKLRVGE